MAPASRCPIEKKKWYSAGLAASEYVVGVARCPQSAIRLRNHGPDVARSPKSPAFLGPPTSLHWNRTLSKPGPPKFRGPHARRLGRRANGRRGSVLVHARTALPARKTQSANSDALPLHCGSGCATFSCPRAALCDRRANTRTPKSIVAGRWVGMTLRSALPRPGGWLSATG
jgi:hypothetical protein